MFAFVAVLGFVTMFILFTIYFRINFDFVVVYYTDDGSLELGSETFGLVAYHVNV